VQNVLQMNTIFQLNEFHNRNENVAHVHFSITDDKKGVAFCVSMKNERWQTRTYQLRIIGFARIFVFSVVCVCVFYLRLLFPKGET